MLECGLTFSPTRPSALLFHPTQGLESERDSCDDIGQEKTEDNMADTRQ